MMRTVLLALLALTALSACGSDPEPTSVRAAPEPSAPSSPPAVSASPPSASAVPRTVAIPAGMKAGVAVYDRQGKAYTVQQNVDQRFRSASLVKLFIAIDYLSSHATVPAAEQPKLDIMLSRSDDNAASHFYDLGGRTAIITRMNKLLGLAVVPPTAPRTGWGSTEVNAADLVRVYRYLLDEAPPRVGQYIVGRIRTGTFTRCGTDGYDQSFGIPTAFAGQPWAAKQGWYEFASAPKTCKSAAPASLPLEASADVVPASFEIAPASVELAPVDFDGEALHTTGIVGANDRTIVVILTVHPHGTPFATATAAVTRLAASLPLTR